MKIKPEIKALTFDVFGTVVDWRSSIIEEGNQLNSEWGLGTELGEFCGPLERNVPAFHGGGTQWKA